MRFCGYGFDVSVADLKAGKRFRRTFQAPDPKVPGGPQVDVVVTLRWDDRNGPMVCQYRPDLMEKIFARVPAEEKGR